MCAPYAYAYLPSASASWLDSLLVAFGLTLEAGSEELHALHHYCSSTCNMILVLILVTNTFLLFVNVISVTRMRVLDTLQPCTLL